MRNGSVTVLNTAGMHARAATELAKLARQFESSVRVAKRREDDVPPEVIECTDVLQLMSMGAAKGEVIDVEIEGADEEQAFEAIVEFFESGCGEGVD